MARANFLGVGICHGWQIPGVPGKTMPVCRQADLPSDNVALCVSLKRRIIKLDVTEDMLHVFVLV